MYGNRGPRTSRYVHHGYHPGPVQGSEGYLSAWLTSASGILRQLHRRSYRSVTHGLTSNTVTPTLCSRCVNLHPQPISAAQLALHRSSYGIQGHRSGHSSTLPLVMSTPATEMMHPHVLGFRIYSVGQGIRAGRPYFGRLNGRISPSHMDPSPQVLGIPNRCYSYVKPTSKWISGS